VRGAVVAAISHTRQRHRGRVGWSIATLSADGRHELADRPYAVIIFSPPLLAGKPWLILPRPLNLSPRGASRRSNRRAVLYPSTFAPLCVLLHGKSWSLIRLDDTDSFADLLLSFCMRINCPDKSVKRKVTARYALASAKQLPPSARRILTLAIRAREFTSHSAEPLSPTSATLRVRFKLKASKTMGEKRSTP